MILNTVQSYTGKLDTMLLYTVILDTVLLCIVILETVLVYTVISDTVWSTWSSKEDHGRNDYHLGQNGQQMVFFLPQSSLFIFSLVSMVL